MAEWTLHLGDCRGVLPTLPAGSFDACLCDPPYPEIARPYGRLTEAEWHSLMRAVVPEVRRVLKPHGSAVFVLQPNYRTPGRMRTWLWDFLAWVGREWGVVQDVYWWNVAALPAQGCQRAYGLTRSSLKYCVWAGGPTCFRDQDAVLWSESEANRAARLSARLVSRITRRGESGKADNLHSLRTTAPGRGGVTPFNVLPLPRNSERESNGAATPLALCDWWCRYLVPPGGAVLDPFCGSGTTGVAALRRGCAFVGVEKEAAYVATARKRLAEAQGPLFAAAAGG